MRLFLGVSLVILFLWLQSAQKSSNSRNVCEVTSMGVKRDSSCTNWWQNKATSMSEAVVSFLLSPLSLYSWMASTLLRFIVSLPALVFSALHHSLLLLLAGPWCVATICISFLLTCLHVGLYLLHMALVVGAMAFLTLNRHKKPDRSDVDESKENYIKAWIQQKRLEGRLRRSGCRIAQQG